MSAGRLPLCSMAVRKVKQGRRDRFSSSARQHGTPSHSPCLLCAASEQWDFLPRTCTSQLTQERACLAGPPPPSATMTSLAHLWEPTNSGLVATFLRRAAFNETPSLARRTSSRSPVGHAVRTPTWCPLLTGLLRTKEAHQQRPPIFCCPSLTRPNPCRAQACRFGLVLQLLGKSSPPRSPGRNRDVPTSLPVHNPPDDGHRRREGRPHRQVHTNRKRCCRRRHRRTTRNKWDGICVSRLVGTTVNAAPAPGPACDRINACV